MPQTMDIPPPRLDTRKARQVPDIFRIVLSRAKKQQYEGKVTAPEFRAILQRVRNELKEAGFSLEAHEMKDGTSFVIKCRESRAVCGSIEVQP
jgi:hypothetical protein